MNGFLVSVWGDDVKAVRLFATRGEAESFCRELHAHYGFSDETDSWRGNWRDHHPDVKAADTGPGGVGRELNNYWITEFRDGRPVA